MSECVLAYVRICYADKYLCFLMPPDTHALYLQLLI